MTIKANSASGQAIHLGPRFAVRGSHKVLHVRDLDGFEETNTDRGELLNNAYLVSTPIVRKNGGHYHLINHDHHGLANQLDLLNNGSTIWAFVLEDGYDEETFEKIRFFTQLALVQCSSLNKFANNFIQQIATNDLYQNWLIDHHGLKMFKKPSDQCPVNTASLSGILGIPTEKRVKDNLATGWQFRAELSESSEDNKEPDTQSNTPLNNEKKTTSDTTEPAAEIDVLPSLTEADASINSETNKNNTSPVDNSSAPHALEPTDKTEPRDLGDQHQDEPLITSNTIEPDNDDTDAEDTNLESVLDMHREPNIDSQPPAFERETEAELAADTGEQPPSEKVIADYESIDHTTAQAIWNAFADAEDQPDYDTWKERMQKTNKAAAFINRFTKRILESKGHEDLKAFSEEVDKALKSFKV